MKYGLPIRIDLPKGFLEAETRCGYEVPVKLKKIWAVHSIVCWRFRRMRSRSLISSRLDSRTGDSSARTRVCATA